MIKACPTCKKPFKTYRSKRIYCSHVCFLKSPTNTTNKRGNNNISKRLAVRNKMSKARMGVKPWNKGTKGIMKSWNKGKKLPQFSGENHPRWKGGWKTRKRYKGILVNGKQCLEHRIVMEKYLSRKLKPSEVIHHKNGNRTDNRIENLELFSSHNKHMRERHSKL